MRTAAIGGAWLAAASAVAYGSLAIFAKLAYEEGWNVPSLLTARFLLAALFVAPLAIRGRGSWRGFGGAFLVGAIGYAGTTAFYFPSLRLLPAGVASFLLYLAPPIVALFGWLIFRERLGARGLFAMALALAGLAFFAWGETDLPILGILLGAASGLVFGGTVLASRHLVSNLAWPRVTLGVSAGAFASYLVFSLATRQLEVPASTPGLLYVLGLGTLATGVALSLFMAALPRIGAARTALISTLEPVSTLILAVPILHELPGPAALLGGGLIVIAAAVVASETRSTPTIP